LGLELAWTWCCLAACGTPESSPPDAGFTPDTDYTIDVDLVGECSSLQGREFQVGSEVQTNTFPYPSSYGTDLCDVAHFMLCTPNHAAFLEVPLHVVVRENGAVLSDQLIDRPGCRYSSIDGNSETISVFVESDGTVRTDFGVHPLVSIQCEDSWPSSCYGRDDLPVQ